EAVAVCELQALVDEAEFWADGRCPAHRTIHVQPDIVATAYFADRVNRVHRVRGSGAHGRGDHARQRSASHVALNSLSEILGHHRTGSVHVDKADRFAAQAGYAYRLLDRGMRL